MLRLILLLCFTFAAPVFAQDAGVLIAPAAETGYLVNTSQFVWLDNDTLIFEPPRTPGSVGAYEYHVSTNAVTRLDVSPLYFVPTPKRVEHYQIQISESDISYNSFRSPFAYSESLLRDVIYLSQLSIACGFECPSRIIMAGVHDDQPDYNSAELGEQEQQEIPPLDYIVTRTYHALHVNAAYSIAVHWAPAAGAALIETAYPLGVGARLYYVNLSNQAYGVYAPEIYIGDTFPELGTQLYAVSEDGTRVIHGVYQPEEPSQELLRVWEVIPAPSNALWAAQVLPSISIAPGSDAEDAFAGANFMPGDAGQILALHSDGIIRIDLTTDAREVLNPEITTQDYPLGVFSPDNRAIAVVTESGDVRVLPTGIQ